MPRTFVGSKVFGATSGDHLSLEVGASHLVTITYQPSQSKLKESKKYAAPKQHEKTKRKLLEMRGSSRYLSIYPLNTLPLHPNFLKPKYEKIVSIALEGFDFEIPGSVEDVRDLLEELPAGFVKDFSFGLGLLKDYRFVINAIEEIPKIKHLIISRNNKTGISEEFYTLSFKDYDSIRRGINRISSKRQNDSAKDKWILAHNVLLTSLDPLHFPEKIRHYEKDTIFKLFSSDSGKPISLSEADRNAAVRLVDQNKRAIAEKAPERLLQLRKDIELVTLEVLITKYDEMARKDLPEARWQELFSNNPFILNLAFGYPVVRIQGQAHVGGRTLSGSGETIADFLVKNGISNNAALFEIKTPGAPLLNKKAYRGQLYTPSSDLAGAINQMLDQRNEFQKDIARIKENSRIYNLESYAVHGVLVIGRTPVGLDQQKSFELFRGNSKDIAIITFDELLAKLKLLHEFLSSNAPEARQAAVLQGLETKVLRLQHDFKRLFEYTKSRSGSVRITISKPLPGVGGMSATDVIAKLGVLKFGLDRARLRKPPYPVAFDESGERIIRVQTLDELIARAEKTIADADAVLALHV
jgi:Domain of unknown function (DUF4263)